MSKSEFLAHLKYDFIAEVPLPICLPPQIVIAITHAVLIGLRDYENGRGV
jgi:hypothetical protein